LDIPLSLLKEIFSYEKAWSSDLRWAVAKATKNTVFKVTYFKEALSIGSNGSSIGMLPTCSEELSYMCHPRHFPQQPISLKEVAKADLVISFNG
jgi:hypothetical protein